MGLTDDVLVLQRIESLIKNASPNRAARKKVVEDQSFLAVVPPSTVTQASSGPSAAVAMPIPPTPITQPSSTLIAPVAMNISSPYQVAPPSALSGSNEPAFHLVSGQRLPVTVTRSE